jgi:hypothetical protein
MMEASPALCNANVRAVRLMASGVDDSVVGATFQCTLESERFKIHSNPSIHDDPSYDSIGFFPAQLEAENNAQCQVDGSIVSCVGIDESYLDVTVCCSNPSSGLLLHTYGSWNTPSSLGMESTARLLQIDMGVSISLDSKTVLFRDGDSKQLTIDPVDASCQQQFTVPDGPYGFVCTSSVNDNNDAVTALYVQF